MFPFPDPGVQNYALEFVVAGIVGMVRTWSLGGFRQSPEDMAQLANRLILRGIAGQ